MRTEFDILIIEDEQVVIDSAKRILTSEGFTVNAVLDAESALQKLKKDKYKLILTDLMLPKTSGLELIEIVKRKYPQIPMIIITGYATLENAVQSLKVGAFDFIPKPFSFEELLGVVSRAINFIELMRSAKQEEDSIERLIKQLRQIDDKEKFYFLGKHSWAKLDKDGCAIVGVGETFYKIIGKIQQVVFPSVNEKIDQGNVCTRIITQDQLVHTVWAPLSGKVIKNNLEVEKNAGLINTTPFSQGWLLRIIPTNLEMELVNLTSY